MNAATMVAAEKFLAPAKINLALHVCGKRSDGYHLLDSLVVFAEIGDLIQASSADGIALDVTGPFAASLAGEKNNLVLRAAALLKADTKTRSGAHITLEKNLPVASGIGGGSSDAAAALRACGKLWNADPTTLTNETLASVLGADVPVCLFAKPAFMSGIGELVEPAPALPDLYLVLANPGTLLSTRDVFTSLTDFSDPIERKAFSGLTSVQDLTDALFRVRNDLMGPAVKLSPSIRDVLEALDGSRGCLLSRLSGSGPTCFGIYGTEADASTAAVQIADARPGWWVRAARVPGGR